MADIKNVGSQNLPIDPNARKIGASADKISPPNQPPGKAVGRDAVGQPIGLPEAEPTTQNALMPSVVTGRDATQLLAAEKMRTNGGYSATDVLLGLNRQPSTSGVLLAPPGNLDALRHLTPTARRTVLRNLLAKQRAQMRRLAAVMRDDEHDENHAEHDNDEAENEAGESKILLPPAKAFYNENSYRDLAATTRMLDLLDELLGMQDYTLSQMGTFAQG